MFIAILQVKVTNSSSSSSIMTNVALFYEPFHELEQLLGPALYRSNPHTAASESSRPLRPKLDLHEDADKNLVTVTLELPGVKKEDVQLSVHNNVLAVSAETQISSEHDVSGYAVRERQYGKLSRSLRLPQGINDDDVKATMADGVLTITFPRSSPEEEPKKITIA